ncbi:MAG: hypothetical protein HZC05_00545 [Candidatus Magasanikbacteria bacterium]|nr:hypothetical protein [Candidatus Magasanikbacteria bacterium]
MLICHSAQLSFLRRSFESGNLAHAYLFVGPDGVGKKKMALELANWCLGRGEAVPAGFPVKQGMTGDLSHDWQIKFVERVYDEKTGKLRKDISINQIHEVRESLNQRK